MNRPIDDLLASSEMKDMMRRVDAFIEEQIRRAICCQDRPVPGIESERLTDVDGEGSSTVESAVKLRESSGFDSRPRLIAKSGRIENHE